MNMSFRSKQKMSIFIFVSMTILVFGFQNCSKTKLDKIEAQVIKHYNGTAELCLNNLSATAVSSLLHPQPAPPDLSKYTIARYFLIHLNLLNKKSDFSLDSDSDGVADTEESTHQMNPLQRRSVSNMLDGICAFNLGFQDCATFIPVCDSTEGPLGLSQCDIMAAGITQPNLISTAGVDSDHDGIPDLIEILKRTGLSQADLLFDSDGDGQLNYQEINQGSSVNFSEAGHLDLDFTHSIAAQRIYGNPDCLNGESWVLNFEKLPLVKTPAFENLEDVSTDPLLIHFRHRSNENQALLTIELKPISNSVSLKNKLYIYPFNFDSGTLPLNIVVTKLIFVGDL